MRYVNIYSALEKLSIENNCYDKLNQKYDLKEFCSLLESFAHEFDSQSMNMKHDDLEQTVIFDLAFSILVFYQREISTSQACKLLEKADKYNFMVKQTEKGHCVIMRIYLQY